MVPWRIGVKDIRPHRDWLNKKSHLHRESAHEFSADTRGTLRFRNLYMWGAAANLDPQTVRDLAMYFSALPPQKAANDGDNELVAAGRTIYQQGVPDSNIVACVACHGPSGEGIREIPRLGGLAFTYLKRRLEQWGEGYNAATGPPMPHIADNLSPPQIAALASCSELHSAMNPSPGMMGGGLGPVFEPRNLPRSSPTIAPAIPPAATLAAPPIEVWNPHPLRNVRFFWPKFGTSRKR